MSPTNPLPSIVAAVAFQAAAGVATAQDLYDPAILRTINLQFHDANWQTLIVQNYQSQTNILADLTMDGVTYPNVGVRARGNTSYTQLPSGSQKWSLNVDMDFVDPIQDLLGYDTLNLNNGFHDPTFCREVIYNNIVAKYIPNSRANHVVVTLNGQNWGVYINYQQFDQTMLKDFFADETGVRVKCANNPQGPGLIYNGTSQSGYAAYEIKHDGGLANPWGAHIAVCNAITNGSTANIGQIDAILALDGSIWSTALENLLTDDDSYMNKGCDFVTYRDPLDGRTHILQADANESFTQTTWAPTRNFTSTNRPLFSHCFANTEMRQRFFAHYRDALMAELSWTNLEPLFTAQRTLIDAAVQADTKKLYTYTLFQSNFTSQVTLPYSGPAGGTVPGLQQFVDGRRAYLLTQAEVVAAGPTIAGASVSDEHPQPGESIWLRAEVANAGTGISAVTGLFRTAPGVFSRVAMLDNGASGDGAAGDGVYGALLPVSATAGQKVEWYVMAKATNSYGSLSFLPVRSELAPNVFSFGFGESGVRVTEFMYFGADGEFFELTNLTDEPIDLTSWSTDDESGQPGAFPLAGTGVLAPGASVLVTDVDPALFRAAWFVPASTVVLGPNLTAEIGRNDEINLFDGSGNLVERLRYGDEVFPGTIRTRNVSGVTCAADMGADDIGAWFFASPADANGSWVSAGADIGSPGVYTGWTCSANPCPADLDANGAVDGADLASILSNWGLGGAGDLDGSGAVDGADLAAILGSWGPC